MDPAVLVDPFNSGLRVDHRQLASLVSGMLRRGVAPGLEHVAPMSKPAVLVRLLMNQATRAEGAGRARRARPLHKRITAIASA